MVPTMTWTLTLQGARAGRLKTSKGSGAEVLTMDSLRQLLAEQSVSLLQAQQVQIGASLKAFEDRQAVRLEGIEATVQSQGTAVTSLETQVKELAARVAKVEGQPAMALNHGGPDRRHTLVFGGWSQDTRKGVLLKQLAQAMAALDLQWYLDAEPFCTGARRSVALCQFRKREGEGEDQPRGRMLHIIQVIGASKVELAGGVALGVLQQDTGGARASQLGLGSAQGYP